MNEAVADAVPLTEGEIRSREALAKARAEQVKDPETGQVLPKPKAPPKPPQEPRTDNEPGIPGRLAVYRWISEQPKQCDDTDRKRQFRVWAEANPVQFEDKLANLEDLWAAKAPKAAPAAESEPDAPSPIPEMEDEWELFKEFAKSRKPK